jgi:hypothetical protein
VENNLLGLAGRQGPPNTAGQLADANRLNMQFRTLTDALDNGPAQRADELFSASRLNDASRKSARNFGGQVGSMKGNRPFYDLTRAGMNVMPNLTPDSGSIGRLAFIPVAGGAINGITGALGADNRLEGGAEGAGSGVAKGLAAVGLLSALYSKGGQRAIQKSLLGPRAEGVKRLGDFLKKNPRIGGILGAALSRDLFLQPELPE